MFRRGATRNEALRVFGLAVAAAVVAGTVGGCNAGSGGGGSSGAWKPTRSVTIDVPFAPGGGSDVFGRALQKGIQDVRPGVHVNVVNKPAGNGAVGYSFFYGKKGDPYYLLPSETVGVALPLTTKTPWKWTDFTPIMQIAEDVNLLVVPAKSPYRDLKSAVAALRKGTRERMGLTGATSVDGIDTSMIERDQKVKFNRVVFDSGGEEVAAMLGGDIDMAMLNPSEVIGQIKAGKVRAIAVFAEKRYTKAPLDQVPTAKEQGIDVSFTQYRGVFATGGITKAQQKYWIDTIAKWTKSPAYKQYIDSNYLNPVQRNQSEFRKYLTEYQKQLESVLQKD